MKKLMSLLLFVASVNGYAQRTDSAYVNNKLLPASVEQSGVKEKHGFKYWVSPAVLLSYGFIAQDNHGLKNLNRSTKVEIEEHHTNRITHLDDYLQYTPAIAVYGLNAAGIKGKNNFRDRTIIYGLSTVLSTIFVYSMKSITKVERPDGSSNNSFPSGHTATAFGNAEFLRMEYKNNSAWYGIAGYAAATATGGLRMLNNKHWLSDIVAGAGVGILSTKLAYCLYPAVKRLLFKERPVKATVML